MSEPTKIELLAPARDKAAGVVAVDYGADAVYIGGPGFGARRAAGNSVSDIAELVKYAHLFGARVYATLNTIIYDSELADAERIARELLAAGVDALIVQDMAYLGMGLGAVEFHASTQTSVRTPEDAAFLGQTGFRRLILERALSLSEIRAIRSATTAELEVFVHGAICVGYSGRCFMSRSVGARSGNRGECSQPCRLPYDLVDAGGRTIIKGKHLLSVRDLDLSERIGELLDAGVGSFKIEGRLKDLGYIKNTVAYYRGVIDKALVARPHLQRASVGRSDPDFTPVPAKSFTRGATDYFLDGAVRGVASFDTPKSVGAPIGVVERTGAGWFSLKDSGAQLSAGDGICFVSGGELAGTNINRVEGEQITPNRMDGIAQGVEVFRNFDHSFARTLETSRVKRRVGVSAVINMTPERLQATYTDQTGLSVAVTRTGEFAEPKNPEKMRTILAEQLAKSGETIFEVESVDVVGEVWFVPSSLLAEVRREALAELFRQRQRLVPMRYPATEDPTAQFPRRAIAASENVVNHLAEQFYRNHGATEIEAGLDLRPTLDGEAVMHTRYCLRRELGECLRKKPHLTGDLSLVHGSARYRLAFDCSACEMILTKI
ncbi:MAG: U32 family peptidase [Rikenellaceae bacterium]|jgi:putative protease|nr:U32 family peptidase [Rikenellaceae bacterium]